MILAVATAVLTGFSGQITVLTNYESAVRCAGLTEAASELEGGESAQGRRLFDAALYWSLAASRAGDASAHPFNVIDSDLTRARIRAVRELASGDAGAREGLAGCLNRAPRLD